MSQNDSSNMMPLHPSSKHVLLFISAWNSSRPASIRHLCHPENFDFDLDLGMPPLNANYDDHAVTPDVLEALFHGTIFAEHRVPLAISRVPSPGQDGFSVVKVHTAVHRQYLRAGLKIVCQSGERRLVGYRGVYRFVVEESPETGPLITRLSYETLEMNEHVKFDRLSLNWVRTAQQSSGYSQARVEQAEREAENVGGPVIL